MNDRLQATKNVDMLGLVGKTTSIKKVAAHEYAGPCPKCGGKDRFRVDPERGWFCRQCTGEPGSGGYWNDQADFIMWLHGVKLEAAITRLLGDRGFTKVELQQIAADRQERKSGREQEEKQRSITARQELNTKQEWKDYAAHSLAVPSWGKRGIGPDWVTYYGLGYCENREYKMGDNRFMSDSLTIPYHVYDFDKSEYHVIDLKHRLLKTDSPGGKYRHHISGLGNKLFFADVLMKNPIGDLLIVEGEIKAIVTWQACWENEICNFPNLTIVSVPGKSWKEEWISLFRSEGIERVFVCLDPDANRESDKLVTQFSNSVSVKLPAKIDDLILADALDMSKLSEIMENLWSQKYA